MGDKQNGNVTLQVDENLSSDSYSLRCPVCVSISQLGHEENIWDLWMFRPLPYHRHLNVVSKRKSPVFLGRMQAVPGDANLLGPGVTGACTQVERHFVKFLCHRFIVVWPNIKVGKTGMLWSRNNNNNNTSIDSNNPQNSQITKEVARRSGLIFGWPGRVNYEVTRLVPIPDCQEAWYGDAGGQGHEAGEGRCGHSGPARSLWEQVCGTGRKRRHTKQCPLP